MSVPNPRFNGLIPESDAPPETPSVSFAIGDTVRLRSGGPLMTVKSTGQVLTCIWFDATGSLKQDNFSVHVVYRDTSAISTKSS
jgi:uncharacterized protein YodC (DUF2158 family)